MMLFALNLALAGMLAASAGWLAERICFRGAVALRHAVLFVALSVVGAAPLLACLGQSAGIGLLPAVPAPAQIVKTDRAPPAALNRRSAIESAPRTQVEPRTLSEDRHRANFRQLAVGALPIIARILVATWAAGTIFQLSRLMQSMRLLRRLASTARSVGPDIRRLTASATRRLALRHAPEVSWCAAAPSPLVMGLFRARVLLPHSVDSLSVDELDAVLLHELAHIARHDQWAGLAVALIRALFWWCLPVGLITRRLGDLREQLCDAHVVASQGHGLNLAAALLNVCEGAMRGRPVFAAAAALGAAGSSGRALRIRIQSLTNEDEQPMTHTSFGTRLAVSALGLLIAGAVTIVNIRTADALPATPLGGTLTTTMRTLSATDFWQNEGAASKHDLDDAALDRLGKLVDNSAERPEIRLRAAKLLCDHNGHSRFNPNLSEADNARAVTTAFEYLEAHFADAEVAKYAPQRGFSHMTISFDGNAHWVLIETAGGSHSFNGGLNIGVDIKAAKVTTIKQWGDIRPAEEAPARK